jgi:hypothetical protein
MINSKVSAIAAVFFASVTTRNAVVDAYLFNGKAADVQISRGLMDKVAFTSVEELSAKPPSSKPAFGLEKVAGPIVGSITVEAQVATAAEDAEVEEASTTPVVSSTEDTIEATPVAQASTPPEATTVAEDASAPSQADVTVPTETIASATPEMSEGGSSSGNVATEDSMVATAITTTPEISEESVPHTADVGASTTLAMSEESASDVADMVASAAATPLPEVSGGAESAAINTMTDMPVNVADMMAETVQQATEVIGAAAGTIQQVADAASTLM